MSLREGPAPWAIGRRALIAAPRERVWSTVTEPSGLSAWLGGCREATLEPGAVWRFDGTTILGARPDRDVEMEVMAFDAPSRLELAWAIDRAPTRVAIELEPHLGETDVRVTQIAADTIDWPTEPREPNWWWIHLPALRATIERGEPDLLVDYSLLPGASRLRFVVRASTFPWVIWSKLADPNELRRWWATEPRVELRPGGEFRLGEEPVGPRRVLEVSEGELLAHDWVHADGTTSRVEWRIEETDEDTIISVLDAGPWPAEDAALERRVRERRAVGWAGRLLALREMAVRGRSPHEDHWAPV